MTYSSIRAHTKKSILMPHHNTQHPQFTTQLIYSPTSLHSLTLEAISLEVSQPKSCCSGPLNLRVRRRYLGMFEVPSNIENKIKKWIRHGERNSKSGREKPQHDTLEAWGGMIAPWVFVDHHGGGPIPECYVLSVCLSCLCCIG